MVSLKEVILDDIPPWVLKAPPLILLVIQTMGYLSIITVSKTFPRKSTVIERHRNQSYYFRYRTLEISSFK